MNMDIKTENKSNAAIVHAKSIRRASTQGGFLNIVIGLIIALILLNIIYFSDFWKRMGRTILHMIHIFGGWKNR